jgi:hypothetical protein
MNVAPIEVCETFSEEITPASGEALLARMSEHASRGVERVVLNISSPGGEVATAMKLYEELRAAPFELVTRNVGEVASMANMVFLAGETRYAAQEATFLLHPVAFAGAIRRDADHFHHRRRELERHTGSSRRLLECDRAIIRLEREDRGVREIVEQRTKLSDLEIATLVRESRPVGAAYALAAGIVHEVVAAHSA